MAIVAIILATIILWFILSMIRIILICELYECKICDAVTEDCRDISQVDWPSLSVEEMKAEWDRIEGYFNKTFNYQ